MTDSEIEQIESLIEARLSEFEKRIERRIVTMVNERTTNAISASTLIVGGVQEDLQSIGAGLESLSENSAGRWGIIDGELREIRRDIAAWQVGADKRTRRIEQIAAALNLPPLEER